MKKRLTKIFLITLSSLQPFFSLADTGADSLKHLQYSWKSLALHTGIGIQQSGYLEMGAAFVSHEFDRKEGFGNGILYSSFEWTPVKNVYGIKVGGELGSNLSMLCVELKHQFTDAENDFVISPKIGLGIGFANLYYGYNFSTSKYPFEGIGKHQFSIIFNVTPKYFRRVGKK